MGYVIHVAYVSSHISLNNLKLIIMTTKELPPIPPKSNPFNHDQYHMGIYVGDNCMIMVPNHQSEECEYVIVVNITTGERLKVDIRAIQPTVLEI